MKEYIVTEHFCFPYEEPKPHELIRCRECRFWPELTWNVTNTELKFMVSSRCIHMGPEDYCSKGKRRNDD